MIDEGSDRPPRVLFVDDEPLVVRSLRRTLATRNVAWETSFAESGAEALAITERQAVDVIVSDMHMPGMDGATLLRRVQERSPETVRIILSGQTDPKLVFRAVPVAHQFLTKPFDTKMLIATIERALELRKLIASAALRSVLSGDNQLPTAPKTYTELTRLLSREDVPLQQIVELIEHDPALAARVAQLGSSSFFRVPRSVVSLAGIVSYLGVDIIKTLVLSVEIVGVFPTRSPVPGFSIEEFQHHSVRVAHIARRILDRSELAENAFLAGVLHDVGRLVLAARRPGMLADAIACSTAKGISLHAAEQAVLGLTHAEIGGYLLGTWGFPLEIVDAVLFHHTPQKHGADPMSVAKAVYLANLLAHDPEAALDAAWPASVKQSVPPPSEGRIEQFRRVAREIVTGEI